MTGSFAAAQRAAVASSSLLFCYAESPSEIAERAGLVTATTAGNVYLCEPLDPVAFEHSWIESNVRYAALAQVAADCLTGPDRMPSEGDALLEWMEVNESLWRVDA